MSKRNNIDYHPDILGISWTPGNLILVGSRSWGGRIEYVLGNCIVNGTGEFIPAALFAPEGNRFGIMKMIMRMQLGSTVFDDGQFSAKDIKAYPLYIDDTTNLKIPYLVGQIFRLVEEKDVRMVVINRLQDIDCGIIDEGSREGELDATLKLLKALAESLSIIIIVTSKLSRHYVKNGGLPTVRDILDVTEAVAYCDQIILLHPFDPFMEKAKMILPLGHPYYDGKFDSLVLNVSLDREKRFFKKATELFEEESGTSEETPMYKWRPGPFEGECEFDFLDAGGMGWTVCVEPYKESDGTSFSIRVYNWASEETVFNEPICIKNLDSRKKYALKIIREKFPEVEIPVKEQSTDFV